MGARHSPYVWRVDRPRAVLAEDHEGVAEQLRKLLAPEFDVVATVADGHALVQAVEATRPDVVVADIVMPGLDGIAATAAILASRPAARVVLVNLFGAALLLGGCAGQTETVSMQQPGGPPQQMTIPKATMTGAASGAQADALAQAIVDANNNTMKQFDAEGGRLDKLQAAENKDYQTAQQTLSRLEQLSNEQGTGQITLFFKSGSIELDTLVLGQRAHGRVSEDLQHRDGSARGSSGRRAVRVDGGTDARGCREIQGNAQEVSEPACGQPHQVLKPGGVGRDVSNTKEKNHALLFTALERVKVPEGKILIPGVISHTTNLVEHPELIAERIERYARLVGRENVIAGADCGFAASAVRFNDTHPSVAWLKFAAMGEGARLATRHLWGR